MPLWCCFRTDQRHALFRLQVACSPIFILVCLSKPNVWPNCQKAHNVPVAGGGLAHISGSEQIQTFKQGPCEQCDLWSGILHSCHSSTSGRIYKAGLVASWMYRSIGCFTQCLYTPSCSTYPHLSSCISLKMSTDSLSSISLDAQRYDLSKRRVS